MIPVAEIFGPTIQGEGPNTGLKSIFVRVAGCDFKCSWCDSKFAWEVDTKTTRFQNLLQLAAELDKRCRETHTSHIILTGGNPCLYDFGPVIKELKKYNITFDVETQGSKLPDWLLETNTIVISPKAPSSGQPDVMESVQDLLKRIAMLPEYKRPKIAIKIPVFTNEDFKFAERWFELIKGSILGLDVKLYLSVGNTNTTESGDISGRVLADYKKLIDKVISSNMDKVYVMPQVHTLVWGNKQGV